MVEGLKKINKMWAKIRDGRYDQHIFSGNLQDGK